MKRPDETNALAGASDHVVWEYLKLQDAEAWRLAWERAVVPELVSFRTSRKAKDWGVTAEEAMSLLYLDMVGARKLDLYRDDGGSLWGWLRTYVRGYVHDARPDLRMTSLDATDAAGDDDDRDALEKISKQLSDSRGRDAWPTEDPAVRRRERWDLVQKCFADLYRSNPMRAYVHWLRVRMNLSSTAIRRMLGMTSEANVDQTFARAVRDMRKLKVQHEERD